MLTYLKLKNFMSHKNLEFFFDKNFYVITGNNDIGKSALFHAIRWVFQNEPQGSTMIHNGADSCEVTVGYSLGGEPFTVTRKRTGSSNIYTINGETFHKNETPEILQKIFTLNEFGEEKINWNFTFQHDPLFMLGNSNSTNVMLLNTDPFVDTAIKETKSILQKLNKRYTYNLENIAKLEKFLEATEPIETEIVAYDNIISEKNMLHSDTECSIMNLKKCFFIGTIPTIENVPLHNLLKHKYHYPKLIKPIVIEPVEYYKLSLIPSQKTKLKKITVSEYPILLETIPLTNELETLREQGSELRIRKESIELQISKIEVCLTCGKPL